MISGAQIFGPLKFTFSEKATKIDKISTVILTVCSNGQINGEDFVNFCGLLRKHEFYKSRSLRNNSTRTNKSELWSYLSCRRLSYLSEVGGNQTFTND